MNTTVIIGFINLLCVGILAGEEFTICYGVRAPVASLDDRSHIQVRQALIYRLRVLVPAILALTILSGVVTTTVNGIDHGFAFRCAGLAVLFTFIVITLGGTVPINKTALTWNPAAPPANWQALVSRWEQLNTARCWLAVAAFALFLAAIAL
jgi:uncharacterized membrane protein